MGEALIQYRFDSVDQLARHLHQSGDSTLLFIRDERGDIRPGRALLEVQLRFPITTTTSRVQVIGRSAAPMAGAWIQMDSRLARHLQRRGALTARRERRVGAHHMLQLSGPAELLVEMIDVSRGGLRVRGAGNQLQPSDEFAVRLLGCKRLEGDLGAARVIHLDGRESGLRFVEPGNLRVQSFLSKVEAEWHRARRIEHPRNCCIYGPPLEPAAPALHRSLG